jgi:translation elongation factor EF-G
MMGTGPLAGFPVLDVEIDLIDGGIPRRRLLGNRV